MKETIEDKIIRPAQSSDEAMELENRYGAHNYKPLPIVISEADGVVVTDPEGKQYYDFLSAYSALNQGHCHPKIVDAAIEQIKKLTLTSRAFYSDWLGTAEKYMADLFGYDKVLMMNSGVEAVETAIKLARRWGYDKKGVKHNEATIVVASNNFHGRTTNVISFATDNSSRRGFGPFNPGYFVVPYNDLGSIEKAFQMNPNICGFLFEPIQGEAGVNVPDEGYLKGIRALCDEYNVLMMADEIQTGMGRTGKMLCVNHEEVRPDLIILGKALSGGILPASAVLADDEVMLCIQPGEHGSTFGGNPLAARVSVVALQVILEEKLTENATELGAYFRERMRQIQCPYITKVRGKGLLNAIVIDQFNTKTTAYEICLKLKENGLLAKQTHGNIIRFAPPLVINKEQMEKCCDIIESTILGMQF